MSLPAAWPKVLDFFGTLLVITPSPDQLSSDAGLLAIRRPDRPGAFGDSGGAQPGRVTTRRRPARRPARPAGARGAGPKFLPI
jgi:hypothetical protein